MNDCERGKRTIGDLKPGEHGMVSNVVGDGAVRQRILDIGILPNVSVEVERVAPSGDPIWIKTRGCHVSLRKAEAQQVILEGC